VCVSRDIERVLNEKYGITNTEMIYNMMNLNENIRLSQEKLPDEYEKLFDDGNFNFINVGRLTRQKGQWFLIRSFRKLVDKHPNGRLFIIGDGDLKDKLKTLINRLNLNNHVFLLGEQENIFPFLKNSHCFTFTSLWEGFGLVLTEALSLNLPVISTDCKSGPREVLCPELDLGEKIEYPYFGEYGILTELFPDKLIFEDINQIPLIEPESMLADLMIKLVENPGLRKNYSQGQDLAKIFNDDKIINQWTKILKDLTI
jgi:glycosyltransferase involved in cell wall biosynthesis